MPKVILRQTKDKLGSRYLEARLEPSGDVVIDGQDLGGVEIFGAGIREYEYAWTIRAVDVPKLAKALGTADNVLGALQSQYSDDKAAGLFSFLEEQGIPVETWSRHGE